MWGIGGGGGDGGGGGGGGGGIYNKKSMIYVRGDV